ncbi:hypothetical protein LUPAC06_06215 [Micromonospora saelicesensis]|uniref:hypothetical protein n=1 Tax=Micromonospora saelicesensis TaxID=285676 RepID=UPI000DC024E8|nr:hypothetical protein [Micromonospora saelicesensis]RAO51530.1 hypothetical protein LUPAC06_06215 [Micromonospora saelicesensis]
MTTARSATQHLIYGHAQLHDCLAFADANTAAEEAVEIKALAAARTWGEARQVQMTHLWNPAGADCFEPDGEYADGKPFTLNEVGSVVEGDWPPMVTARGLELLPVDVQFQFGKREFTAHNGDFLNIPLDQEAELVAELRRRGYEVTRDDELINVLDGRSFSPLA